MNKSSQDKHAEDQFAREMVTALKTWIVQDESVTGMEVTQPKAKVKPGDASGGLLESVLYITLSAPAVIQLARSLQTWFKTLPALTRERAAEMSFKAKNGKGVEIEISGRNLKGDSAELVKELTKLVQ